MNKTGQSGIVGYREMKKKREFMNLQILVTKWITITKHFDFFSLLRPAHRSAYCVLLGSLETLSVFQELK